MENYKNVTRTGQKEEFVDGKERKKEIKKMTEVLFFCLFDDVPIKSRERGF